jgi:hypothetical protein
MDRTLIGNSNVVTHDGGYFWTGDLIAGLNTVVVADRTAITIEPHRVTEGLVFVGIRFDSSADSPVGDFGVGRTTEEALRYALGAYIHSEEE